MAERRLVTNPHAFVSVRPKPERLPIDVRAVRSFSIECPVRGRGLVVNELRRESHPELFAFFAGLVESDGRAELGSDAKVFGLLREIGFLVFADEVVEWPRFRIPLVPDEAHLPIRLKGRESAEADGPLSVEQSLLFQREFALHPALSWPDEYRRHVGGLLCFARGPACWIGDASTGLTTPFWLDDDTAEIVERLAPGQPAPSLPAQLRQRLLSAGVLVSEGSTQGSSPSAQQLAAFRARRPAVFRDLVHSNELAALRQYTSALMELGLLAYGDRQVDRRFGRYNEPISRFVQARLARFMSTIVGSEVLSTFSFLFCYANQAELTPHRDRREAQYSISLQLDYQPEPHEETHWPLGFTLEDGSTELADLRLGDAAIYHGAEVTHFRTPLPASHRSTHLILEYVGAGFQGPRI